MADRGVAGMRRQLEFDVGQVDQHPIGVGQRRDLEFDGMLQTDDELGARLIAVQRRLVGRLLCPGCLRS